MPASRVALKSARVFHLYSGVFLAPALLFFAFTGAVQSFNWHETTRGSSYKPPVILAKLAQLHKKETLVLPERKSPPSVSKSAPDETRAAVPASSKQVFDPSHLGDHTNQQKHDRLSRRDDAAAQSPVGPAVSEQKPESAGQGKAISETNAPPQKQRNLFPMKLFSFVAGVGLFLSTLTGLYMSYQYSRNKTAITITLLAGLFLPLALLYLQ